MQRQPVRQGDVLLVPVAYMHPQSKSLVPEKRRRGQGIIIAEGEATGHHHRIRSRHARVYNRAGRRYLHVHECNEKKQQATLTHEEHDPITIKPGWYEVVMQREYEPTVRSRSVRVYD